MSRKKTGGSAADEVYAALVNDIAEGRFLPGSPLRTESIAAMQSVSRTPVREAIQRLERDGLVTVEKNCGATVRVFTLDEADQIAELRQHLETIAVRRLVENGVPAAVLRKLEAFCRKREQATTFADEKLNDIAFHRAIVQACGADILIDICTRHLIIDMALTTTPGIARQRTKADSTRVDCEHEAILEAIAAGDAERASRLMHDHLDYARRALTFRSKQAAQSA